MTKIVRPTWEQTYITMCYVMGLRSPDRSTKVGSVVTTEDNVVLVTGYNGLVRGMDDADHLHERPGKYLYFEHGERNAIYNASRIGVRMDLAHTLYVTWIPCADCARAIAQTGIRKVVVHKNGYDAFLHSRSDGVWDESHKATMNIFKEAAQPVELEYYTGPTLGDIPAMFFGKKYIFNEEGFEEMPWEDKDLEVKIT